MLPARKIDRRQGQGRRIDFPGNSARLLAARILTAVMLASTLAAGCALPDSPAREAKLTAVDYSGKAAYFSDSPTRVAVLQASLADLWLTAGGHIAGVTEDAQERGLEVAGAKIVGTTKHPSLEAILALEPELVLYSPDIAGQVEAAEALEKLHVQTFGAKVDSFDDYLYYLKTFTDLTGERERYETYGTAVQTRLQNIVAAVPEGKAPRVLFLRAYSSGIKAKAREHVVCDILDDFQAVNIAAVRESLLEELSLETIVQEDPDVILIAFMGQKDDSTAAMLQATLFSQPAWKTLTAVKNGCIYDLPTELFHYKPNGRWAEAYQYLYDILYGSQSTQ